MADLSFNCPSCGGSLTVDSIGRGLTVPCPKCGDEIRIPDPATPPNKPPPQTKPVKLPAPLSPPTTHAAPNTKSGMSYGQGIVVILLLFVALGLPIFKFAKPIEQWEYRIESPSDLSLETRLNSLGSEGWEMVFARRASSGDEYARTVQYEMIFKRPKR